MTGEFDLIALIRARCTVARTDVGLGIGDDGALLIPPPGQELVVTTDTLVAGMHFPLTTRAEDIGWKALAVNLSDLAAMGASPAWASLAMTLPEGSVDFVARFADGFAELAVQHQVALIGGDTTKGAPTITITAQGFVPPGQALRRDGARAGEQVFVTGTLGDAAAGLRCLMAPGADAEHADPAHRAQLLQRLNRPQPRVAAGIALRGLASACIDVSDGLLADLGHIARASGVGIELDATNLPTSSALRALFDPATRLAMQLGGGDDYELAFCVPADRIEAMQQAMHDIGCAVTCVGGVVEANGVRVLDEQGLEINTAHRGWEHFS